MYENLSIFLFFAGICGFISGVYQFIVRAEKKAIHHLQIASITAKYAKLSWVDTAKKPIIWLIPKLDKIYGTPQHEEDIISYFSQSSWRSSASIVFCYVYIIPTIITLIYLAYIEVYSFFVIYVLTIAFIYAILLFLTYFKFEKEYKISSKISFSLLVSYVFNLLVLFFSPKDWDLLDQFYISTLNSSIILFIPFICQCILGVLRSGPKSLVNALSIISLYYLSQFSFSFLLFLLKAIIDWLITVVPLTQWGVEQIALAALLILVCVFVFFVSIVPILIVVREISPRKFGVLEFLSRQFYKILILGLIPYIYLTGSGGAYTESDFVHALEGFMSLIALLAFVPIILIYTPVFANSVSDLISISFTRYIMNVLIRENNIPQLFACLIVDVFVALLCVGLSLLIIIGGFGFGGYLLKFSYFSKFFDNEIMYGFSNSMFEVKSMASDILILQISERMAELNYIWVVIMMLFAMTGALPTILNLFMIFWVIFVRFFNAWTGAFLLWIHSLLMEKNQDGMLIGVWRSSVLIGLFGGATVVCLVALWDHVNIDVLQ